MDAGVEAALGVALLAGFGAGDFPHPVGRVLVVTVGALLLALAVFLWRGGIGLRFLAAGNLLTATLAVVWLALAPGFSAAGAALVAAAIAALAILATLQLASALRYPNAESTPASGGGISSGSSAATSSGG